MWFFFRRNRKKRSVFDRLICGIIIGGAIGSIIGRKLLEKREKEEGNADEDEETSENDSQSQG